VALYKIIPEFRPLHELVTHTGVFPKCRTRLNELRVPHHFTRGRLPYHRRPHCLQSLRIRVHRGGVAYVHVRIDPTRQPNGIAFDVPPSLRIVVAEVVVEEPRLGIAILARQYPNRPLPQSAF
jgi:hypothetical protein